MKKRLVLLAITLLAGCKTMGNDGEGIYVGDFGNSNIRNDCFVVGGVGVADSASNPASPEGANARSPSQALANGRLLESAMRDRRSMNVKGPILLVKALSPAKYQSKLRAYQSEGELQNSTFKELGKRVAGCRYLVFGLIESDEIEQSDNTGGYARFFTTSRKVDVRFDVYDLNSQAVVWHGNYRGHSARSNNRPDAGGLVGAIIDKVKSENPAQYPKPPPLAETAKGTYGTFAEDLPRWWQIF